MAHREVEELVAMESVRRDEVREGVETEGRESERRDDPSVEESCHWGDKVARTTSTVLHPLHIFSLNRIIMHYAN